MIRLTLNVLLLIFVYSSLNANEKEGYRLKEFYLGQNFQEVEKTLTSEFKEIKSQNEVIKVFDGHKHSIVKAGKKISAYKGDKFYRVYVDFKGRVYFLQRSFRYEVSPNLDKIVQSIKDKYGKPSKQEGPYQFDFSLCYGSCGTKQDKTGSTLQIKYHAGGIDFLALDYDLKRGYDNGIYKLQKESADREEEKSLKEREKASTIDL